MMHSFITILLVAFAAIFPGLYAAKLQKQLIPQGDLCVALDYSLATDWPAGQNTKGQNLNSWLFSSHLTFKDSVDSITDAQLWKISYDAIAEMDKDLDQYMVPKKQRPNAMGIMAWGKEIILTSSQRIGPSYSYTTGVESSAKDGSQQDVVLKSLKLCQNVEKSPSGYDLSQKHKNDGKCVEPMSANMYYILQKPKEGGSGGTDDSNYDDSEDEDYGDRTPLKDQKPRIAVWTYQEVTEDGKTIKKWVQTPPCMKDGNGEDLSLWGCNLFTQRQGQIAIDTNLEPQDYDLDTIAGGAIGKGQVQLCGTLRDFLKEKAEAAKKGKGKGGK